MGGKLSHTGINQIPEETDKEHEETEKQEKANKQTKRYLDTEEEEEYPGVSSQKKVKLKAEEIHQAKWDKRHEQKEAADLKRSIQKELRQHQIKGEQKEEDHEDK
eukprot:16437536-Heterocapsa_arctica.AAC.1